MKGMIESAEPTRFAQEIEQPTLVERMEGAEYATSEISINLKAIRSTVEHLMVAVGMLAKQVGVEVVVPCPYPNEPGQELIRV